MEQEKEKIALDRTLMGPILTDMEKPLHVRVAEALGCVPEPFDNRQLGWLCQCLDFVHGDEEFEGSDRCWVKDYDTDWSATGPLIEKYGITLVNEGPTWHACGRDDHKGIEMTAGGWHDGPVVYQETPLLAVCNLILILKETGKL